MPTPRRASIIGCIMDSWLEKWNINAEQVSDSPASLHKEKDFEVNPKSNYIIFLWLLHILNFQGIHWDKSDTKGLNLFHNLVYMASSWSGDTIIL